MTHRGGRVDPAQIRRVALLTVEGENDDISGVGQTEAAHRLCVNIPSERKAHWLQPGGRSLRRVQWLAFPRRDRAAHRGLRALEQCASGRGSGRRATNVKPVVAAAGNGAVHKLSVAPVRAASE